MLAGWKHNEAVIRRAIGAVLVLASLLMIATGNETIQALGMILFCIAIVVFGAKRAAPEARSDQRRTAA